MFRFHGLASRSVAVAVVMAVTMNSLAFAGQNTSGVQALSNEIKAMRGQIDSGTKASDAIDTFAKAIAEKGVTARDVDQYVKSRLSVREYQAFQQTMDQAMKGIQPEQLNQEELGQLVGQALTQVGSEGLSWSSCASTWTGVGLLVAAILVAMEARIKGKSDAQIQSDYQEKIRNSNSVYNGLIDRSNNWQTRIPADIQYYQYELERDWSDYYYYQNLYYSTDDDALRQQYADRMRDADNDISSDNYNIARLTTLFNNYTANPSLAVADAARYAVERDQAVVNLNAELNQAIADGPANREQGQRLGIGAGIGAAAGGFFVYRGWRDGCPIW